MSKFFGSNPFERYADDIIVHCESRQEAEDLLGCIRERLQKFELELHPEKTKLVYCKNYRRKEEHEHNSFTFLSYSFQPRGMSVKGSNHKFMGFGAAISCKAKAFIRQRIREVFHPRNTQVALEEVALKLNPKIRGWLNYYCRFSAGVARNVFLYLNELIRRWIKEKYRINSKKAIWHKFRSVVRLCKSLFVHWQIGIIN